MAIVRCPRCRDEVTVPARASREALVRCPLCVEEYRLSEALADMPPTLIVIGGDEEDEGELVGAGVESTSAAAEGANEGDYRMASPGFAPAVFDSSAPSTATAAPVMRPTVSGARPKRKEKSAVAEILKVIVGGVVGLAIGLVVLWWAVGKDPLDLGPTVAQYAPWIVPAKSHGKTKTGENTTAGDSTAGNAKAANGMGHVTTGGIMGPEGPNPSDRAQQPADGDFQPGARFEEALQKANADAGNANAGNHLVTEGPGVFTPTLPDPITAQPLDPGAELTIDNPLETTRPASAEIPAPDLSPSELPLPVEPPTEPSGAAEATTEATAAEPPPMPDLTNLLPDSTAPAESPATIPAEAPLAPTPDEFASATSSAAEALATYDATETGDAAARKDNFTAMYLAGSEAGRVVSYLSTSDPELSEPLAQLKGFLDSIAGASGPSKVNAVKFLASQHWPERKHDEGLLVAGVVKDFKAVGPLFEIVLDASVRQSQIEIPVVSATNPQDFAATGDELVIVGRVVENPKEQLPGYEGDAERVLVLGYSVKVPK